MAKYASLFTDTGDETEKMPVTAELSKPYKVLLVDDEPNVLKALKRIFHQENYEIFIAGSGSEALEVLKIEPCQLMITDYMMPGMNGTDLLRNVKDKYPDIIRIMLTGHADTTAVMGAVKEGAVYKFILKPWNDDDLRVTVALALEQYDLLQKNNQLKQKTEQYAKEIKKLTKLAVSNRSQLAILLHRRELINEQQLQKLYQQQQRVKEPALKLILKYGWVSEKEIRKVLAKDLMIEQVSLSEFQIDPAVLSLLPCSFCESNWVLPLKFVNKRLTLVMADPMDEGLVDDLKFSLGVYINVVMANIDDIREKIKETYEGSVSFKEMETLVADVDPYDGIEIVIEEEDDISIDELLRDTQDPPAIRLVNAIVLEAVRLGASDIHIQPRTKSVVVRYRIDGVLFDKIHVPHNLHMALVSRIKVMSELDITERRRPQDGRITVKTPMRIVDLRISTLPTINGEKIVMRMLDRNSSVHRLDDLGFAEIEKNKIINVVSKPQGIILATGPTGSGKTTTLYSLLQHNATAEKNYVTLEDPVEYYMDMAGQVMIKEKIGLDFSTVLRAILRQDPDVILIGEIRDFDTAEVAFHAALTGHLVYSTLHTNSAFATIARLLDLGLKPYVVATALEAIIAQRLVRKICKHCIEEEEVSVDIEHKLGPIFKVEKSKYYKGKGCVKCNNTGYMGRVAIYEVVIPTENMRHLISSGGSVLEISRLAEKEGERTLIEDAKIKVNKGLTTVDEILRVLGAQVVV